jgi:hypothetical protein
MMSDNGFSEGATGSDVEFKKNMLNLIWTESISTSTAHLLVKAVIVCDPLPERHGLAKQQLFVAHITNHVHVLLHLEKLE